MNVGLRIDVDTFRGTKLGVPGLCRLLERHDIRATLFFSVGPDNMGRHIWRLLRPAFLWKMLRTQATSLYGWDILFKGTFWPGPMIGLKLGDIIRAAADAGHEVGLHAWDHHAWQKHIDHMDVETIYGELKKGYDLLTKILGQSPTCSAAPGWKCNETVLLAQSRFSFEYNSDCRGNRIFLPFNGDQALGAPQVPVTLPTYDEMVGHNGITSDNYNDTLLSLMDPNRLNVLTIHAEVEGIAYRDLFDEFLTKSHRNNITFVTLGSLVKECSSIGQAAIEHRSIPGREGWIAYQSDVAACKLDTANPERHCT